MVGSNNYVGITISAPVDVFGWLAYFGSYLIVSEDMSFSGILVHCAKGFKRLPISFRRATRGVNEHYGFIEDLFEYGQELSGEGSDSFNIFLGEVVSRDYQPVDRYVWRFANVLPVTAWLGRRKNGYFVFYIS